MRHAAAHSAVEPELMVCGRRTFVPRLMPSGAILADHVCLHFHSRGAFDNLYLSPQEVVPEAGVGLVVLRVRCVGLNFRDVLNVLGEYPGDPGPPGGDCAGLLADSGSMDAMLDAVFGVAYAPIGL